MLFFYVRHGDPTYSPDALTPLGRRQAEAVGRRLARFGLDRIYASTSTRAIQTAEPAAEMLKLPITQLDWCNESHAWRDYAIEYEPGKRTWCFARRDIQNIFNETAIQEMGDQWYTDPRLTEYHFENGEERIRRESDAFFAELGYQRVGKSGVYQVTKSNSERVALFAHQGFGMAFLSHLLHIPYPVFTTHFDISHSNLTVIEFAERDGFAVPKVLTWSSDGHLYAENLPTAYNNSKHLRY